MWQKRKNAEEVYLTYYRMKRRQTYLEERDVANGVFYYSPLDTEEINGEDAILEPISILVCGYGGK